MKTTLKISGMHCPSCAILIHDALEEAGAKSKIDHKKGLAVIEFDEAKLSLDQIKSIIQKEGYKAEP